MPPRGHPCQHVAMKTLQMAAPDPTDFCTVAYAAEKIGISQRHVRRLCTADVLPSAKPRCGAQESGRRHLLLYVSAVDEFALAYKLTRNRAVS